MSNSTQEEALPTETQAKPNLWLVPLLGVVGLAVLLGILLSPAGGFIASIMTLNSWATSGLLIWAAGSLFYIMSKIEGQGRVAPGWAWMAFFITLILAGAWLTSRASATASLIDKLVMAEHTVEKLVMAAGPADLEQFRRAEGEAVATLKAIENLEGTANMRLSLSGAGMMVSDVSNITTYAFLLENDGWTESYTYRPCKEIVSAYLALDGVIQSKNILRINGQKLQASASSPCQFSFNQIKLQKI